MSQKTAQFISKQKRVSLSNKIEIAYHDAGTGQQTLLFIHGLAGFSEFWYKQIESLKKDFRCIAIDLPGCGNSSKEAYSYDMPFFCDVISEFIDVLNLKYVIPVGHSMGGQISIALAVKYPGRFRQLILVAPAGFERFSKHEVDAISHIMAFGGMFINHESQLANFVKQSFYQYSNEASDMVEDLLTNVHQSNKVLWRRMVSKCIHMMLSENTYDQLQKINENVLVIFGEKDLMIPNVFIHPYTTRQVAQTACNNIRKGKLIMIPFSGHFVFFEKAGETNRYISQFVSEFIDKAN